MTRGPVSVRYVWDADYGGIEFPRKKTTVLRITGPKRGLYWRAATLDLFDSDRWLEAPSAVGRGTSYTRSSTRPWGQTQAEAHVRALAATVDRASHQRARVRPAAARPGPGNRSTWVRQDVEVVGLRDQRVIGAAQPVALEGPRLGTFHQFADGIVVVDRDLRRGQRYTVWSYAPRPQPAELARVEAEYPAALDRFRDIGRTRVDPFGRPGRDARVDALFADDRYAALWPYEELWNQARRLRAGARTPYGAVVAIETWLRTTGGFAYDESPPPAAGLAAARALRRRREAGLLPALRRRDGADAPLPRRSPRAWPPGSRAASARTAAGRSPTTTRTRGSRSGSRATAGSLSIRRRAAAASPLRTARLRQRSTQATRPRRSVPPAAAPPPAGPESSDQLALLKEQLAERNAARQGGGGGNSGRSALWVLLLALGVAGIGDRRGEARAPPPSLPDARSAAACDGGAARARRASWPTRESREPERDAGRAARARADRARRRRAEVRGGRSRRRASGRPPGQPPRPTRHAASCARCSARFAERSRPGRPAARSRRAPVAPDVIPHAVVMAAGLGTAAASADGAVREAGAPDRRQARRRPGSSGSSSRRAAGRRRSSSAISASRFPALLGDGERLRRRAPLRHPAAAGRLGRRGSACSRGAAVPRRAPPTPCLHAGERRRRRGRSRATAARSRSGVSPRACRCGCATASSNASATSTAPDELSGAPLWARRRRGARASLPRQPSLGARERVSSRDRRGRGCGGGRDRADARPDESARPAGAQLPLPEPAMTDAYDLFQQGRTHLKEGMAAQATVALEKAKKLEPDEGLDPRGARDRLFPDPALAGGRGRVPGRARALADGRLRALRARPGAREAGPGRRGERPLQARQLAFTEQRALRRADHGARRRGLTDEGRRPAGCTRVRASRRLRRGGDRSRRSSFSSASRPVTRRSTPTGSRARSRGCASSRTRTASSIARCSTRAAPRSSSASSRCSPTRRRGTARASRTPPSPQRRTSLYERFCAALCATWASRCRPGVFGARMEVELVNDGPVTIVLDVR